MVLAVFGATMRLLSRFPTLALGLVVVNACGDDTSAVDAAPPDADPLCLEAVNHSDLEWIQENVFTPSCARFPACHQGKAPMAGELSLEAGETHAELVGIESSLFPQFDRVVPGDASASYLMVQLGSVDGPLTEAGTMPYNSPLLCQEMRDAIARWIDEGANSMRWREPTRVGIVIQTRTERGEQ